MHFLTTITTEVYDLGTTIIKFGLLMGGFVLVCNIGGAVYGWMRRHVSEGGRWAAGYALAGGAVVLAVWCHY
jgi:hypothetical protein